MVKARVMVKFFTQVCPKSDIAGPSSAIHKTPRCCTFKKGQLVPYIEQARNYVDKDDKVKEPAKEEAMDLKMPGFVHPETKNEEGYFTQKAKNQLEELKRRLERPQMDNPDKKE